MVRISFDGEGSPIQPTLVLTTRAGTTIGAVIPEGLVVSDSLTDACEISFSAHKELNGTVSPYWEQLANFKLLYVPEFDKFFEIYVEVQEETETVKFVTGVSLGHAELSQILLFDIEINTENDIAREDYTEPTVFYNPEKPSCSLLHRISEKIPHYRYGHIDETLWNIQRTFTFDDISILDALHQIGEEIGFFVDLPARKPNGEKKPERTINIYDLMSNCNVCGYRGNFIGKCPACTSTDITAGYGNNTTIYVSADSLGDEISLSTDTGAVKNCFCVVGGDDVVTAALRNVNPNGSNYVWYFPKYTLSDMSAELREKIEEYTAKHAYFYGVGDIPDVSGYSWYVPTATDPITGARLFWTNDAPSTGEGDETRNAVFWRYNRLVDKYQTAGGRFRKVPNKMVGYAQVAEYYYNVIDLRMYLTDEMMMNVELDDTSATAQRDSLGYIAYTMYGNNLGKIYLSSLSDLENRGTELATLLLNQAMAAIDCRYAVNIVGEVHIDTGTPAVYMDVTIENRSESTDITDTFTLWCEIGSVSDDMESYDNYVRMRVKTLLSREKIDNVSVAAVFNIDKTSLAMFERILTAYSLNELKGIYSIAQSAIDILIEQGVGTRESWDGKNPNLYDDLYLPYRARLEAAAAEMALREQEIKQINDMVKDFEVIRRTVNEVVSVEYVLGAELFKELAAYRREQRYSNENYISDGLTDAEVFAHAKELYKKAENDIYKSAEQQHSISTTLKNLMAIERFKPLVKFFSVGNYIRVYTDEEVYKLRLLSYTVDFDNFDRIPVEFSDMMKTASGITDGKMLVASVRSISSSYSYTQTQASRGSSAKETITEWQEGGLTASETKVETGGRQAQTWDENGILLRKMNEETGEYAPEQMKIVNNTIAITNDAWQTVKAAVGAYIYIDSDGNVQQMYGVNAETVVGKLILGETLSIGSEDSTLSFDSNGLSVSNGTNTFVVDPNSQTGLLAIYNGQERVFYVDADGTLHIKADGEDVDIIDNPAFIALAQRVSAIKDVTYDLTQQGSEISLVGSDGTVDTVRAENITYTLEMPSLGVVQLKGSDGSVSEIRLPCAGGGDNLPVDAAFMAIYNDGDGLIGTVEDATFEVVS